MLALLGVALLAGSALLTLRRHSTERILHKDEKLVDPIQIISAVAGAVLILMAYASTVQIRPIGPKTSRGAHTVADEKAETDFITVGGRAGSSLHILKVIAGRTD